MDKVTGENFLKKIHKEIIMCNQQYKLPWSLLSRINEEYMGHLQNKDGQCFFYQWLAHLVKIVKPNLILELGSGEGLSTLMLFSELSDTARLVSCDLVNRLDFIPPDVFNDPRFKFYPGNDLNLNIFGNDLPVGIDMLFIDTIHTFTQISAEWRIYKHLCNSGAIVILDDIRMNDMFDFWESLSYPKLELTKECHFSGFGFFLYESDSNPNPLNAYHEALQNVFEQYDLMKDEIKRNTFISLIWKKIANRLHLKEATLRNNKKLKEDL
ncbi:MAG: class I SAM-dependent methyltransferase [Proteobacteria bacterium]|nr:class I SAM-dependent methyltransferase [Pseudomonadota bacterium]